MVKHFTGENDRVKLLVLLCGGDDDLLMKAASGTLAVLSSLQVDLDEIKGVELNPDESKRLNDLLEDNRIICEKIVNVSRVQRSSVWLPCEGVALGGVVRRNIQASLCLDRFGTSISSVLYSQEHRRGEQGVSNTNRRHGTNGDTLCHERNQRQSIDQRKGR